MLVVWHVLPQEVEGGGFLVLSVMGVWYLVRCKGRGGGSIIVAQCDGRVCWWAPCLYSAVPLQPSASTVRCLYSAVPLQCDASTVRCLYSAMCLQCNASTVRCLYSSAVPLQQCGKGSSLGAQHFGLAGLFNSGTSRYPGIS